MLRLGPNSQRSCPCGLKMCANNKKGKSIQKKITFWAKKRGQNGFFGVFRKNSRTALRKFAVMLRLSPNLQDRRSIACSRCCTNKKDNLMEKKMRFEPQIHQKIGFLWDYRSTLKRFGILLYDSDETHTHRIVAQLGMQAVATIKRPLYKKNFRFQPQNFRKIGFSGVSRSALKRFAILLYNSDDAQN